MQPAHDCDEVFSKHEHPPIRPAGAVNPGLLEPPKLRCGALQTGGLAQLVLRQECWCIRQWPAPVSYSTMSGHFGLDCDSILSGPRCADRPPDGRFRRITHSSRVDSLVMFNRTGPGGLGVRPVIEHRDPARHCVRARPRFFLAARGRRPARCRTPLRSSAARARRPASRSGSCPT